MQALEQVACRASAGKHFARVRIAPEALGAEASGGPIAKRGFHEKTLVSRRFAVAGRARKRKRSLMFAAALPRN
jgi:hypothetical protein